MTEKDPNGHILFLGMATLDIVTVVPRLPGSDQVIESRSVTLHGGGPAATAAVACARLGGRARFAGVLGDDPLSRSILSGLDAEGVETGLVRQCHDSESPSAVILVEEDSGHRSILYSRGTATTPTGTGELREAVRNARMLHLDGFHIETAILAAQHARAAGVPVSFDGGAGGPWPRQDELMPLVDLMVVARDFATRATQEDDPRAAARALRERFRSREVVVTDGARGAWFDYLGGEGHVPAFSVEVVDTTGAGDVFHGAYVLARAEGQDVPGAVRFAAAVAGLKCRAVGGRAGIPTRAEAEALLAGNVR